MPVPLTDYGRKALTRLSNLYWLAGLIPADNRAFNAKIHEAQERRRADTLALLRATLGPRLSPGQTIEDLVSFTEENGSEKNAPYTHALEQFVAESVLCSCVDTYHWYLRRVFESALTADRSRINVWAKPLKLGLKKVTEVNTCGDLGPVISSIFRGSEEPFRVLAHEFLNVPDLATIPKAVVVRNCLVHELGKDRAGKVAAALVQDNDLGITLDDGNVLLPVGAAYEIARRFIEDVSIMDQALANILGLPTDPSPLPSFTRAYS